MSLAHPFTPLTINDDVGQILFTPCPGTKEVGLQNSLEHLCKSMTRQRMQKLMRIY